jgi:hypothetical protein
VFTKESCGFVSKAEFVCIVETNVDHNKRIKRKKKIKEGMNHDLKGKGKEGRKKNDKQST